MIRDSNLIKEAVQLSNDGGHLRGQVAGVHVALRSLMILSQPELELVCATNAKLRVGAR